MSLPNTLALIWAPGFLTFMAYNYILAHSPSASLDWTRLDREFWHSRHGDTEPVHILKHVFETPRWCVLIPLILACVMWLARARHNFTRLKTRMFWVVFTVLMGVRCLGTFSGTLHYRSTKKWEIERRMDVLLMMFPPFASSPARGFWLHWVLRLRLWSGKVCTTYAGRAEEVEVDVEKKRLEYEHWIPNWLRAGKRKEGGWAEASELNCGWRDNVVRLGYYHVLDATLHIVCLRWFWGFGEDGEAFTPYVNNEEILVVVLVGVMLAWTWIKMGAGKKRDEEVRLEEAVIEEK